VTSSAKITSLNTSKQEALTATNLASTCTASKSGGVSGSTTVTAGRLQTSEGNPAVQGDETFVDVPARPEPNTTYTGKVESVGDTFRYVFNEQVVQADGSIIVNAAHQYLLGPTAVGELILGQSRCATTSGAFGDSQRIGGILARTGLRSDQQILLGLGLVLAGLMALQVAVRRRRTV